MSQLRVPTNFVPIDAQSAKCTPWAANAAGVIIRSPAKWIMPFSCVDRANTLLAAMPRTSFCRAMPQAAADTSGKDPLYLWQTADDIYNAHQYVVKIIAKPTTASTSYTSYGMRYGSSGAYATAGQYGLFPDVSTFADTFEASYVVERGDRTLGDWLDGISTIDGYTVLAVVVQDASTGILDTDLHKYCDPSLIRSGKWILASALDDVRDKIHELRQYCLPVVFSWSSVGATATPSQPGDETCITVTSTSYVNILDQTVTSRTATSPGVSVARMYAGLGLSASIPVTGRVYAKATTADGYVKFIGPDHVASNETAITVPAGTVGVFGSDSSVFYLNSEAHPDLETTERNKIDVHAKVDAGGTLNLYNATAWELYSG